MLAAVETLAVMLILFALSNPVKVLLKTVYKERGADIVFILDASPSMAALDITNSEGDLVNRFDAARNLLASFAEERPADALGLVAVGEDAALLVPPTVDHELFRQRLESLKIGEFGDGTALGMGLSIAAYHLRQSAAPLRAAVLVTDGENNAGAVHPETAARAVAGAGAALFVIGMGGGGEVMIDYVDPESGQRRRGIPDSRYDTESLVRVAESGNGVFLEARTGGELSRAFFRVSESSSLPLRTEIERSTESFADVFIIASFILLLLSFILRIVLIS
jgi:Ca-activated chloride channel family protein